MQKQLTVRLGEMHTHYHVSGIYYSIPDALKMQHVSVKLSDSWRKLMELIAEQQENGSHKQKQEEQRVRYEKQRIQSEEMDRKWQERVLYAQHLCIDRKRAWIERQRSHEALDGQDVRKWEHSKIDKLEMQLEVMVANLGRRHDCLSCPECVCCASRVGISYSRGYAICHQSFEDRHRAYFATTKRLVRSRDKGKFKFAGLFFEEPYSPSSDDVTNESFKEPYSPSSDDAANDASSDEGSAQSEPQVKHNSPSYIKSITAENTHSQAPADVVAEELDMRSTTKSVGRQMRSSASDDPSAPSGVNTSTVNGARSRAQSSRAPDKQASSDEEDDDTHCRGVKQVINDFKMVKEVYRQGFNHYHIGEIAEHMEQIAIGPDARYYGPSDDGNQGTALCNRAEGRSSDESNASLQHRGYSSTEECGRSERNIESCSSDHSGDCGERNIESCSSDDSGDCGRNIQSCRSDDSMEW